MYNFRNCKEGICIKIGIILVISSRLLTQVTASTKRAGKTKEGGCERSLYDWGTQQGLSRFLLLLPWLGQWVIRWCHWHWQLQERIATVIQWLAGCSDTSTASAPEAENQTMEWWYVRTYLSAASEDMISHPCVSWTFPISKDGLRAVLVSSNLDSEMSVSLRNVISSFSAHVTLVPHLPFTPHTEPKTWIFKATGIFGHKLFIYMLKLIYAHQFWTIK